MPDESTYLAVTLLTLLGGLAIMLYGVKLDAGMRINGWMYAGGAIASISVASLAAWAISLSGGEGVEAH